MKSVTATRIGAVTHESREGKTRPCTRCGILIRPRVDTKDPTCRDCRAVEMADAAAAR